jgi:Fe-S cluster biogenesis protein NfuA/nitrite reductase/ring-hydroxylating ferredoxin subunit
VPERAAGSTLDRVGTLLREVGNAPTVERAKERSEELVRALVAFYGDGLERVLDIVHDAAGDRSEAIFGALCRDGFVESLLALHGLHPLSIEDRVQAALDSIRPYLESHEGNVELVRVVDGVAYVRLAGSCDGCQSSAATLKNAVETAILEHVAEIVEVRPEGAGAAPAATHSLKLHSDWVALDALPELAENGLARITCSGTPVLLVSREQTVFAYRDCCPVCTRRLEEARLEWPFVRCAGCGERFDVVHAGRVAENSDRSAEPFPLIREGDRVRIAIPLGV